MSENETYGMRLEKKIDSMQHQMSEMNSALIRLSERNEAHQSLSSSNKDSITTLQADMNQAKGGLNFAKLIAGTALASVIGFGTWTVQSVSSTQQRISDANQRIAIVESKLIRLDTDISVLSKRNVLGHENEQ
jgi:peptidoglycan hydrolase CwlO-like protein